MGQVSKTQKVAPEVSIATSEMNWTDIIKEWKLSGLSQKAYCKDKHLNINQFVYQLGKLSGRIKSGGKLLPVKLTQADDVQSIHPFQPMQSDFVLYYPNGVKLKIPVDAKPDAIKALLSCIEIKSC